MEEDDQRELSMEEKISEGRKRFRAKNDDAALDVAENLFRMNRQVLDVQNAVELMETIDKVRNFGASTSADQNQAEDHPGPGEKITFHELPPFGCSIDGTRLPSLPPFKQLEGIIGSCSQPFEKQLTVTDTSKTHNRLSFNKEDVRRGILPLLNFLDYEDKDLEKGIPVTTYDPRGRKYPMVFKSWANKKVYVLNTVGWNEFVKDNELVGFQDWVSVWAFSQKRTRDLCFALNIKRFQTPVCIKKRSRSEAPRNG